MIKKTVHVKNKLGLHARPAALLVKTAARYQSDVQLEREGQMVNGKSIMGVMMLAAGVGSEITLTVNGRDEEEAMNALVELFENQFQSQEQT